MLFGFQKADLIDAAEVFLVGIMIILVVLLVLQPMVSRLLATEEKDIDEDLEADLLTMRTANPALEGPDAENMLGGEDGEEEDSLIDIQGVDGKVKSSSVRKVEEIIENYPTETVSVIRSWMTQEN